MNRRDFIGGVAAGVVGLNCKTILQLPASEFAYKDCRVDVWKIIGKLTEIHDQRTGLTELLSVRNA